MYYELNEDFLKKFAENEDDKQLNEMYYNCIDKQSEMKYTDHDLIIAQKINLLMDEKLY